jgi:hypothetical protein
MHSYSINTNERRNILFILAAISIFLEKMLSSLPFLQYNWISAPKAFAIYGILCWMFDKWLWIPFSKIGMISTPFLKGTWEANIISSHDSKITTAKLVISQTWTKICFRLESQFSTSYSTDASINVEGDGHFKVTYHYLNKPRSNAPSTMSMHEGTTHITISEDKKSFNGYYFTGKDRRNYGDLFLKKVN